MKNKKRNTYKITLKVEFKNNLQVFETICKLSDYVSKVFDTTDTMISLQMQQHPSGYRMLYNITTNCKRYYNKLSKVSDWLNSKTDLEFLYLYNYTVAEM